MSTGNHKRRQRAKRSGREYLVLALCIAIFAGAGVLGLYNAIVRPPDLPKDPVIIVPPDEQPPPVDTDTGIDDTSNTDDENDDTAGPVFTRKKNYFTILISGIDASNGGSDTNILMSIDGENGAIHAVSLPRDTLINTDWSVKKLNSSYNVGGTARLQKEVSRLLGIPVDYYITVDLDGFIQLVDTIGGIYFDVPVDMDYDDPVQDLHIHFQKGYQYLSGEDALKVVRFRHNNDGTGYGTEDIGRIGTQQQFLTAVAKEMLGKLDPASLQSYADVFVKHVDTDLTVGNLLWIGEQALAMGMENIQFYTLPGDGSGFYEGTSYYILYPDEVCSLVNTSFNPYEQTLSIEDMDILAP